MCGPPATEREKQHRGLRAKVARAQPSGVEEIGPAGEQLGYFPQACIHLALTSAAVNLDGQLG
jgi:hypothetical protein